MPLLHNVYLTQGTHDALTKTLDNLTSTAPNFFGSTSEALEHVIALGIQAADAELKAAAADAVAPIL